MLKNLYQNKTKLLLAMPLVCVLILLRAFEDQLFYDPFLEYFKSEYNNKVLPEIQNFKMFLNLTLRYFINSVCSLGLVYLAFKDVDAVKFASILYVLFFAILIFAFFIILETIGETNKMTLFYIRRFLIQPLFILLFFPAFYYQKQKI